MLDRLRAKLGLAKARVLTTIELFGLGFKSKELVTKDKFPKAFAINPWVFTCVSTITQTASTAPLIVERRRRGGEWEVQETSEIGTLLDWVSEGSDWFAALEMTLSDLLLDGNAYWLPVSGTGKGKPAAFQVLTPTNMKPDADQTGQFRWRYKGPNKDLFYTDEEVIHFKRFSPVNRLLGQSVVQPIESIINAFQLVLAYNQNYLDQGGIPALSMKSKQQPTPELVKEFKELWLNARSAAKASGLPFWHGEDIELKDIGKSPDMVTANKLPIMLRDIIVAAFHCPPSVVGILEYANYANLKQQEKMLWTAAIQPELSRVVSGINGQLIPLLYGQAAARDWRVRFDYSEVEALQAERKESAEIANMDIASGRRTINETREEDGLPPVPWGAEPWFPLSLSQPSEPRPEPAPIIAPPAPGGETLPPPEEPAAIPPPEEEPPPKARVMLEPRHPKYCTKAERHRRAKSYRDEYDTALERLLTPFWAEVGEWYQDLADEVVANVQRDPSLKAAHRLAEPAVERLVFDEEAARRALIALGIPRIKGAWEFGGDLAASAFLLGITFDPDTTAQQALLKQREIVFKTVTEDAQGRVRDSLATGLAEGETEKQLTERVLEWATAGKEAYAQTLARTEVATAMNSATHDAYEQADAPQKEWLSILDDRTRTLANGEFDHVAANGEIVGIKDEFVMTGEPLKHPNDPNGSPGNIINCRCTLAPVYD